MLPSAAVSASRSLKVFNPPVRSACLGPPSRPQATCHYYVLKVRLQDAPEPGFVHDDHVIQAFAAYRSDQTFTWRRLLARPQLPASATRHECVVPPNAGWPGSSDGLGLSHFRYFGTTVASTTFPGPVKSEASSLPCDVSLRLHDQQRRLPISPD